MIIDYLFVASHHIKLSACLIKKCKLSLREMYGFRIYFVWPQSWKALSPMLDIAGDVPVQFEHYSLHYSSELKVREAYSVWNYLYDTFTSTPDLCEINPIWTQISYGTHRKTKCWLYQKGEQKKNQILKKLLAMHWTRKTVYWKIQ